MQSATRVYRSQSGFSACPGLPGGRRFTIEPAHRAVVSSLDARRRMQQVRRRSATPPGRVAHEAAHERRPRARDDQPQLKPLQCSTRARSRRLPPPSAAKRATEAQAPPTSAWAPRLRQSAIAQLDRVDRTTLRTRKIPTRSSCRHVRPTARSPTARLDGLRRRCRGSVLYGRGVDPTVGWTPPVPQRYEPRVRPSRLAVHQEVLEVIGH
jgi:hypothetical protein